jgi:hypothetical protein
LQGAVFFPHLGHLAAGKQKIAGAVFQSGLLDRKFDRLVCDRARHDCDAVCIRETFRSPVVTFTPPKSISTSTAWVETRPRLSVGRQPRPRTRKPKWAMMAKGKRYSEPVGLAA